jgi:hypothetical protein
VEVRFQNQLTKPGIRLGDRGYLARSGATVMVVVETRLSPRI